MYKIGIKEKATIIKLRGLGFSQAEIAEKLGNVSPATIGYQLKKIKALALKHGIDDVYEYYVYWNKK